jgi:hypothetical protein
MRALKQIAFVLMALLPLDAPDMAHNPAVDNGGLSPASPSAPPLRGYGVSIN